MQTTKTNAKRRRTSNRYACNVYSRYQTGTSHGQPLQIGFFLNRLMNPNGTLNKEALVKSFNSELYG